MVIGTATVFSCTGIVRHLRSGFGVCGGGKKDACTLVRWFACWELWNLSLLDIWRQFMSRVLSMIYPSSSVQCGPWGLPAGRCASQPWRGLVTQAVAESPECTYRGYLGAWVHFRMNLGVPIFLESVFRAKISMCAPVWGIWGAFGAPIDYHLQRVKAICR